LAAWSPGYPVLDVVALAGVFSSLQRRHDGPAGLGLLGLGIVLLAVSDSSWWYLSEVQSGLPSVTPVETGWVAGFLLVAIAAHGSSERRPRRHSATQRRWILVLPSLPAISGVLIVLADWLLRGSVESAGVLLAITLAVVLLGVALLVIATYENTRSRATSSSASMSARPSSRSERPSLRRPSATTGALVQNSSDLVMVVDGI